MIENPTHGPFFEDLVLGQDIVHATPRTVTEGDQSLYMGLTGSRFVLQSSEVFAKDLGFEAAPLDDLMVFHLVFGRSVPDVSLNAVANLGYARGIFGVPVYAGDTLSAASEIIGLKETSSGKTGIVYLRTVGINQREEPVLDYVRWVMVRKRNAGSPAPEPHVPRLPDAVDVHEIGVPAGLHLSAYNAQQAGSADLWEDYQVGERIDHVDGLTVEEAGHMMAARLYQNPARYHLNAHLEKDGRFGRRLVFGGHVISLARTLSFNGLANGFRIAAINGGRHVAPTFGGDTIYAWTEILDKVELPRRKDVGALRLRTVATKDRPCADFPDRDAAGGFDPAVVLEFDYTVLMPRLR